MKSPDRPMPTPPTALAPSLARLAIVALLLAGCRSETPDPATPDPAPQPPVASDPASEPNPPALNPSDPSRSDPKSSDPGQPSSTPHDPPPAKIDPPVKPTPAADPQSTSNNRRLTRELLDESLDLGRSFMLANQKPSGNFRYHSDLISGEDYGEENQVRQAGALWGLALIHQDNPRPETRAAVLKGLHYFAECSDATRDRGTLIEYPGDFRGQTGTVALVTLAWIDFIRTASDDPQLPAYQEQLGDYLKFLLSLRRNDGRFRGEYRFGSGLALGQPSPYYDGEVLLAFCKAARHLKQEALQPLILESAETMYQQYVVEARKKDPDSDQTKAFYQWSSMAFLEMHQAGWPGTEPYAKRTIELGHWMIDVHKTLERRRNTGYAHEGLICAWELARATGDQASQEKFANVINQGLGELSTWQVGSSVANPYLREHPPKDRSAIGGILGAPDEPGLRIDVAQHQLHAVILARRYLLP